MNKINENSSVQDKMRGYFTKDIQDQVFNMSNQDMRDILKGLEGTPIWFAIMKYTQSRVSTMQDSFLTLDPLKDAVKIARYQGAITGMIDLQDAVLTLKYESKKAENPNSKKEKAIEDSGGAYGVI
jgi:hypothetical protein